MPFAVTTPAGHVVRLDDVPVADLHKIAVDAGLDSWSELMFAPVRNGAAAEALFRHICESAGDKAPEPLTPKALLTAFEWVGDDLPDSYEGGLPKAEDEQTTDGSSGAPSGTSGPPPPPAASPFENSNS